jgi:tetratricopeptide (TPR) repeat protein
MVQINKKYVITAIMALLIVSGCAFYDNFTTYFNTYYNIERLMKESEEEFEWQDEKLRTTPRIFVPDPQIAEGTINTSETPPFLESFIISKQKLQPVAIKLDSIIIKGSKILTRHPNSNYVEGTLFHMAKSYFYRNEWLPSQIKCGELIDKYPMGDYSPDAHLLYSENLLIQRKFEAGKVMLSRTVDIAWLKERYDILSEAFNLQAELALYEKDMEGAVRPYKQAIAQVDDQSVRARWQVNLAALYYRMHQFDKAAENFKKVHTFSPDYQAKFEADLYLAMSLIRLGQKERALDILDDLESDGNNEEWLSYVYAGYMTKVRIYEPKEDWISAQKHADTTYMMAPMINTVYFEKGMDHFEKDEFEEAKKFFARTRNMRSPVYRASERLYYYLNLWEQKQKEADPLLKQFETEGNLKQDERAYLAKTLFELGRVYDQLGKKKFALDYYQRSIDVADSKNSETARYLYAMAFAIRDDNKRASDSLMEIVAEQYSLTEYGSDAMLRMGYTKKFVIDTAAELYTSGKSLRTNREYNFAIQQLLRVYHEFPKDEHAPKSLYLIGWIYEKDLIMVDSALYYYQLLIKEYPNTLYASDLGPSVDYLLTLRSGAEMPDSLKPKQVALPGSKAPMVPVHDPQLMQPPGGEKSPFDFDLDAIQNAPGNMLDDAKKKLTDPDTFIPEIKTNLGIDPLKLFGGGDDDDDEDEEKKDEEKEEEEQKEELKKKPEKKGEPQDSTKTNK